MELAPDDEATLRELEASLWRSETRWDPAHMEAILAPDLVEFGRSGRVYSREDALALEHEPFTASLPLDAWRARLLGPDIALVTYVSEVERSEVERANRSSVWSRTEDGWKLRFHQGTPAA
jgi:hypothetical protein